MKILQIEWSCCNWNKLNKGYKKWFFWQIIVLTKKKSEVFEFVSNVNSTIFSIFWILNYFFYISYEIHIYKKNPSYNILGLWVEKMFDLFSIISNWNYDTIYPKRLPSWNMIWNAKSF